MSGPRITERRVLRVLPQRITSDGNKRGRVTVPNSDLFMVGQRVWLQDKNNQSKEYQIKRIVDQFVYLGDPGKGIDHRSDLTSWIKTNKVEMFANEQERPKTPSDQVEWFRHAVEPINAERNIQVDLLGRYVDPNRYDAGEPGDGTLPGGLPASRGQEAPPFGYQYIANIIDKFLTGIEYDKVENTVEGEIEVLTFRLQDVIVKTIQLRYNGVSWIVSDPGVNNILDSFVLQEDGFFLLTEDDEQINLLA